VVHVVVVISNFWSRSEY